MALESRSAPTDPTKKAEMTAARGIALGLGLILFVALCSPVPQPSPSEPPETPSPSPTPDAAAAAEERRKGFHCLSVWDGSNRDLVAQIKRRLNDDDSFEHVDTTITPVNAAGSHILKMEFRAANAFGAKMLLSAWARINPADCKAEIISVKDSNGMSAL